MKDFEHPDITAALRTGYPSWDQPKTPRCPVCGRECDVIFIADSQIVGCEECVQIMEADVVPECFGGEES